MPVFHPAPRACNILGRRCQDWLYQTTEGSADSHRAPPEQNRDAGHKLKYVCEVEQPAFFAGQSLEKPFRDETLVVNVPEFA